MRRPAAVLASALCVSACATIPSEAPVLSAELGKRISAIEESNMTLLQRFFDLKRQDVEQFIDEVWVPTLTTDILNRSAISQTWDDIVASGDKDDRQEFIIRVGSKLQKAINQKRAELIRPLDEIERHIRQRLQHEFDQARSINNTLTSFLTSASEISRTRSRLCIATRSIPAGPSRG